MILALSNFNLSSNHFLYSQIQPSLMLNGWFKGFLHQDLMHENGWIYAFDVGNGPPQRRFMLPQHIKQLLFLL